MVCASRAPLAERSAVNRQVLGSIPSGGDPSVFAFFAADTKQEFRPVCVEGWRGTMTPRTHGATAARRIPDPKVGGSNPSGFIPFPFFFPYRASFQFFVLDLSETLPPELRWQSGRLLTDRSLVRSQVVAHYFSLPFSIVFFSIAPVRVRALFFMPSAFYEIGGYTPVA